MSQWHREKFTIWADAERLNLLIEEAVRTFPGCQLRQVETR